MFSGEKMDRPTTQILSPSESEEELMKLLKGGEIITFKELYEFESRPEIWFNHGSDAVDILLRMEFWGKVKIDIAGGVIHSYLAIGRESQTNS